jgi:tellurite resistance protein
MVLGLAGVGQSWRLAHRLWGAPAAIGEALLLLAAAVWASLLIAYLIQTVRKPAVAIAEFRDPVQGSTAALIAVSTLLMVLAVVPYSVPVAWALAVAGIAWHLVFSLWHTGQLWQGGRKVAHTLPAIYLPTVAGNFTCAAALGALGHADWGWLFLGAGVFSWFALESLVFLRLWQAPPVPAPQRPMIGIEFAPPVVCAMAWLMLNPVGHDHWLLMLWGYGLFQLMLGLRLWRWLGDQPFAPSYWAYTFGVASATVVGLKLALNGIPVASVLVLPVFVGANLFIGYLAIRTAVLLVRGRILPEVRP